MSVSRSYSDVIVFCRFSELFDCDVEGTGLLYNRKLNWLKLKFSNWTKYYFKNI